MPSLVDSGHSLELYHMLFPLDKLWHLAEMEQKIQNTITWRRSMTTRTRRGG